MRYFILLCFSLFAFLDAGGQSLNYESPHPGPEWRFALRVNGSINSNTITPWGSNKSISISDIYDYAEGFGLTLAVADEVCILSQARGAGCVSPYCVTNWTGVDYHACVIVSKINTFNCSDCSEYKICNSFVVSDTLYLVTGITDISGQCISTAPGVPTIAVPLGDIAGETTTIVSNSQTVSITETVTPTGSEYNLEYWLSCDSVTMCFDLQITQNGNTYVFTDEDGDTHPFGYNIISTDGSVDIISSNAGGINTVDLSVPPECPLPYLDLWAEDRICILSGGTVNATPGYTNYVLNGFSTVFPLSWRPLTMNCVTYILSAEDTNGCVHEVTRTFCPERCGGEIVVNSTFSETSVDYNSIGNIYTVTLENLNCDTVNNCFNISVNSTFSDAAVNYSSGLYTIDLDNLNLCDTPPDVSFPVVGCYSQTSAQAVFQLSNLDGLIIADPAGLVIHEVTPDGVEETLSFTLPKPFVSGDYSVTATGGDGCVYEYTATVLDLCDKCNNNDCGNINLTVTDGIETAEESIIQNAIYDYLQANPNCGRETQFSVNAKIEPSICDRTITIPQGHTLLSISVNGNNCPLSAPVAISAGNISLVIADLESCLQSLGYMFSSVTWSQQLSNFIIVINEIQGANLFTRTSESPGGVQATSVVGESNCLTELHVWELGVNCAAIKTIEPPEIGICCPDIQLPCDIASEAEARVWISDWLSMNPDCPETFFYLDNRRTVCDVLAANIPDGGTLITLGSGDNWQVTGGCTAPEILTAAGAVTAANLPAINAALSSPVCYSFCPPNTDTMYVVQNGAAFDFHIEGILIDNRAFTVSGATMSGNNVGTPYDPESNCLNRRILGANYAFKGDCNGSITLLSKEDPPPPVSQFVSAITITNIELLIRAAAPNESDKFLLTAVDGSGAVIPDGECISFVARYLGSNIATYSGVTGNTISTFTNYDPDLFGTPAYGDYIVSPNSGGVFYFSTGQFLIDNSIPPGDVSLHVVIGGNCPGVPVPAYPFPSQVNLPYKW